VPILDDLKEVATLLLSERGEAPIVQDQQLDARQALEEPCMTPVSGKRLRSIEMLKSQGTSNRAIRAPAGVSEKAIRKLVGPSIGSWPIWGCSMMPHRSFAGGLGSRCRRLVRSPVLGRERAVSDQPQALR
jgi:hypothetical protein